MRKCILEEVPWPPLENKTVSQGLFFYLISLYLKSKCLPRSFLKEWASWTPVALEPQCLSARKLLSMTSALIILDNCDICWWAAVTFSSIATVFSSHAVCVKSQPAQIFLHFKLLLQTVVILYSRYSGSHCVKLSLTFAPNTSKIFVVNVEESLTQSEP